MKHLRRISLSFLRSSIIFFFSAVLFSGCIESGISDTIVIKSSTSQEEIFKFPADDAVSFREKGMGQDVNLTQAKIYSQNDARKKLFDKIGKNIEVKINAVYNEFSSDEEKDLFSFTFDLKNFVFGMIEEKVVYEDNDYYQQVKIIYKDGTESTVNRYYIFAVVEKEYVSMAFKNGVDYYFWKYFKNTEKNKEFFNQLKMINLNY